MFEMSEIYNYLDKQIKSKSIMQKIIKIQNSHGPNDGGVWKSEHKEVYLGRNRLSIIDLSKNGNNPLFPWMKAL